MRKYVFYSDSRSNSSDDLDENDIFDSDNDSDVDHIPSRPGRFPKNIVVFILKLRFSVVMCYFQRSA